MATSIETVQFICDQAGLRQRLSFRKMFGEFALYLDGKVVALVCDDQNASPKVGKMSPESRPELVEATA